MELEHNGLTEKIIGATIQVHHQLGPGFIESIYEKALMIELRKRRSMGQGATRSDYKI